MQTPPTPNLPLCRYVLFDPLISKIILERNKLSRFPNFWTKLQKFSQKKIFPHLVNLVNNLLFFQVVWLSIADFIYTRVGDTSSVGISVLRSVRLLRIFKVTR